VTDVLLIEDGRLLDRFKFDTRAEAVILVEDLIQHSYVEWDYNPEEDEWSSNGNVIRIVERAVTVAEKVAWADARIESAAVERGRIEEELRVCNERLKQLDGNIVSLHEKKKALEKTGGVDVTE
jgi:hypothetical protein